jgi:integrase
VLERRSGATLTYAIRFRAYGRRHYLTLGTRDEGWTPKRAQAELDNVLADVRRGLWRPVEPVIVKAPPEESTFWEFATEWMEARSAEGLAAKTISDLEWSLNRHLIWFGHHRLSEITPQEIDRYKVAKIKERAEIEKLSTAEIDEMRVTAKKRGERFQRPRGLSNTSINHTISDLAQVLEAAVEYGLIRSNPATGKRRRLKTARPTRPWIEPEQLMTFLESAPNKRGRLLLAVLAGTGLRIGEALALLWQHVDLGTGTLHVVDAKTPKGVREAHLTPALRQELTLWRVESAHTGSDDYVIATGTGGKHNPSNLRRDVLSKAIETANGTLAKLGIAPIDEITFHSLRRTFASLRCACGDDVRYVADQLGHEDPRFTLRVYAQATNRRDRMAVSHRKQYDRALEWARMGTTDALTVAAFDMQATKSPV